MDEQCLPCVRGVDVVVEAQASPASLVSCALLPHPAAHASCAAHESTRFSSPCLRKKQ